MVGTLTSERNHDERNVFHNSYRKLNIVPMKMQTLIVSCRMKCLQLIGV